jgi:hypothetical protein
MAVDTTLPKWCVDCIQAEFVVAIAACGAVIDFLVAGMQTRGRFTATDCRLETPTFGSPL